MNEERKGFVVFLREPVDLSAAFAVGELSPLFCDSFRPGDGGVFLFRGDDVFAWVPAQNMVAVLERSLVDKYQPRAANGGALASPTVGLADDLLSAARKIKQ